jgi:transposase-like protein
MAMPCRSCGSTHTRVTATERHGPDAWRYCRCLDCGSHYKTIESYAIQKRGAKPGTPAHPNQRKRGGDNPSAVLTEADVLRLKQLAKANVTYAAIAEEFGIHKDTVYRIVKRKRWSHLP